MGGVYQALAQRRVFINVPYDAGYEQNFLALISALISIGRTPRCAADRSQSVQFRIAHGSCFLFPDQTHDLARARSQPPSGSSSRMPGFPPLFAGLSAEQTRPAGLVECPREATQIGSTDAFQISPLLDAGAGQGVPQPR